MAPTANDYVNQSTSSLRHDYVNQASDLRSSPALTSSASDAQAYSPTIKYAQLKLPRREQPEMDADDETEVFACSSLFPSGPIGRSKCAYVNLPELLDGAAGRSEFTATGHQYMNLGRKSSSHCYRETSGALTYAQLDLFADGSSDQNHLNPRRPSHGGDTSGEIETSRSKPEVYASIDFRRTRALSSKVDDELDKGYRKTRHNSTIDTKDVAIN